MEPLEPLLTSEDVAKYLNVDVVTVRRLVSRGQLAAYRIGGEYRFSQAGLREFLEQQHVPAHAKPARIEAGVPAQRRWIVDALPPFLRRRGHQTFLHGSGPQSEGLFGSFTKRAKQVLRYAQEEARSFNHPYVGTEHILLGLIRDEEGVPGKVLDELGIKLQQARGAVEHIVGRGAREPGAEDVELTARAKLVIEYAVEEARALNHRYIGAEHLLLGLLRSGEGVATGVLETMGVSPTQVRTAVVRVLGAAGSKP